MKIQINRQRCAGCSLCEETIPSLFYIDGYHAGIRENYESLLKDNEVLSRQLADLAEHCPLQAISVEYGTEETDSGETSFSAQRLNEMGEAR